MGKVRTSAIFYRRGIPNSQTGFGNMVQGNYAIVQPQYLFNMNRSVKPIVPPTPPATVPSEPVITSASYNSNSNETTVTFTQGSHGGIPIIWLPLYTS